MFDYGNANKDQIEAIRTTKGPVLITAGPGTGKTFTLVQRAIYLIQEEGVEPKQILIATFTEKAAKELITRITNELALRGITVNLNEMYIGTFHSICLRLLKENLEFTRLRKNYRVLDDFDQSYMIFQNFHEFKRIDGFDNLLSSGGMWDKSREIAWFVNNLTEELVEYNDLILDSDIRIAALGEILELYQKILYEDNALDFSAIQAEAYRLLVNNPSVLGAIQEKIKYIMVDEYQDTNYIQEQIIFLLGSQSSNICVVGDDDQGLYRFRGATIRNILEFPIKFPEGNCRIIPLILNYRSDPGITEFYNDWMQSTEGAKFKFSWGKFRYNKRILPSRVIDKESPTVAKLFSKNNEINWFEDIYQFLRSLETSGKLEDFNQIAFLFNSVKHERVARLANYLESKGINVYSPRSAMFFERNEVKLILGFLMLLFPNYVSKLEKQEYQYLQDFHYEYYISCVKLANSYFEQKESKSLQTWVRKTGMKHFNLEGTTDYAFSGLFYQIIQFDPFREILELDLNGGVFDIRPSRNLAMFSKILNKFEYLHRIDVFTRTNIETTVERFFNLYLRLLLDGGITEYEDDSEYAPSGCVSFLTIHQSKGMEFPIVIVDSLQNNPRKSYKDIMIHVEEKYFRRLAFEPYESIKYFDFWRLYYTAFSRAQDLLILACNEDIRTPSMYFREIYRNLPSIYDQRFNLSEFEFNRIKDVAIKDKFSFTSHITVYENCSLQYKFYRELEFAPVRINAMLFGMLVHQTIEDVHKAALRNEVHLINQDNIKVWFDTNYTSLSKSERSYLAEPQKEAALNQILRYTERQSGSWDLIKAAEVDVSLVKPDYILEGKVDLIKGEADTVEIVDFKSEKKPDIFAEKERLENYKRQLQIYAHLVEERTGQKVSKMHLYYTGEESGVPTITFPNEKVEIDNTMRVIGETVQKILGKDFSGRAKSKKICNECDFRFYCGI